MPTWEKEKAKKYYEEHKVEFKVKRRRDRLKEKKQERLRKLKIRGLA